MNKIIWSTISLFLISVSKVFAHQEEAEVTDLSQADWLGPFIATVIIVGAIIIARFIGNKGRTNNKLINK